MPRPIHLDVHDVKQLDPRGSHFRFQAKLRRAPCACARGRAKDADHAPASHARSTNVVTIGWCFLRYSGPFLPSCLFGGGFFGPAAG